jgi:hypothetical protein
MDSENYDFLIYRRGSETKEAKSIELKIPNEMTCEEFKIICIRIFRTKNPRIRKSTTWR